MSKRIDYKNENNIASADKATIAPNQAPNAAPVAAKSSKMTNGSKILAIVLIVLAACAIALLVINLIIDSYVSRINTPHYEDVVIELAPEITDEQVSKAQEMNPDGFEELCMETLLNYAEASHAIKSDENIYNFAIYGINKFADSNDNGIASFVAVASFNKTTKQVTYAVFKEKILTYIPMVGMGGLQDAYEWGGAALLTKTIKHNFGIDINGYIEIDMTSAANFIDNAGGLALSGLDSKKVNDAIVSYNEKFGTEVASVEVSSGKATLNGLQTLAYLRADYEDSNSVFKALGDTIFKSGLKGIKSGVEIVLDGTKTSVQKDDFVAVGKMAVSMLKNAESKVVTVGASTYGEFAFNARNNRVYFCDMIAEREILVNALYAAPEAEK